MTDYVLAMSHLSLRYSDAPKKQAHDVAKLFEVSEDCPIKTGTEAGLDRTGFNTNRANLIKQAHIHNHALVFAADNWMAVSRKIIKPGSSRKRSRVFVADNKETYGRGHDSVFPTFSFVHADDAVGRINLAAVHYPVNGASPRDPNHHINLRYSRKIGKWMDVAGAGEDLAFVNGDFNMNDLLFDWSFFGKFTSIADQLNKHRNTGHGPIDGFASYNGDSRVTAKRFQVFNDKSEFFHTDHHWARAEWLIAPKKGH